jgi:DNA-binding SARP family transcriptional activator
MGAAAVHVSLFGHLTLENEGQPVSCTSAKALELLCYLVIHHERPHPRERLAALLWPDEDIASGKRYLRQALWKLRVALRGPERSPDRAPDIVTPVRSGWLKIHPSVAAGSDLVAFDRVHAATRSIPGAQLSEGDVAGIDDALGSYHGDLLTNWTQEWCAAERLRVREAYLSMIEQVMSYCDTRRHFSKGLHYGSMALRVDPGRETTHRQMMLLHHRAGNRTAAIRQYQLCGAALVEEFGVPPSSATLALYQEICRDQLRELPLQPDAERAYAQGASFERGPVELPSQVSLADPATRGIARPPAPQDGDGSREVQDQVSLGSLARRLDAIQDTLRQLYQVVEDEWGRRLEASRRGEAG